MVISNLYICLFFKDKNSTYPKLYRKVNPGDCPEPFVSVHLKQQSIISDPETGTRKSAVIPKHPAEYQKVKTVKDLFENGLRQSRFYPCLGRRSRFQDPFSWLLYHEVDMKMQAIGSALLKFVRKDVTCDNFVGIFGRNCAEWIIMQQACASYGYTVVPLYSTLGNEAMQHILLQTKMKCLMCSSGTEALQVMDHLESSIECLIIVSRDDKFNEVRFRYSSNVMIFSFDDFAKLGMNSLVPKIEPLPTDLFMINYTSGTTGLPKGVMVQHGQFVGSIITLLEMTEFKMNFTNSTHLSYLPLAHIMEQLISSLFFWLVVDWDF
ncbi:unnamed protein product [Heterobilharzia americana]|nr:unnamed protein product [Heterobilharzia americana]